MGSKVTRSGAAAGKVFTVALAISAYVAGCGDDGGSGSVCAVGEFCPCATTSDCPDPAVEECSAVGVCVASGQDDVGDTGAGDAGNDAADSADDGGDDAGADANPSDTDLDISDAGGDAEDATDVLVDVADGDDTGGDATEDTAPDGYAFDVVDPLDPLNNPWIAFVSRRTGSARLYAIRADGTELTLLDSGDIQAVSPAWSPDGTILAYSAATPDGRRVRLLDVTSGAGDLLDVGFQSIANLAWAPDGSALAIEGRVPDSTESDIIVVPLVGGFEPFPLIEETGRNEVAPVWTGDGRVFFAQGDDTDFNVMVTEVGSGFADNADVPGDVVGGFAVSRYGDVFIYARAAGDVTEFVRYDAATDDETVIGGASDGDPFMGWDDRLLVWVRNVGGGPGEPVNPEILLGDASSGGVLRTLASDAASDTQPAIAPVESDTIDLFWSPL